MFNKDKWLNMDLSSYRDEKVLSKKEDHSIIEGVDLKVIDRFNITNELIKGIPFAIKDNFAIKDTNTTSASKILNDFKPNYDSTVFKKLIESGGVPLFKANLDELAMGGTGLTSNYGKVYNPFHEGYIAGGSSSGSVYLVADKTVPFSIGSDTGDSVRKPSSYTGIIGYKPTWGLVSRYGLYDFAPSWDTVGWLTNTIKESALLMDILQGYDEKDQSSLHPEESNFLEGIELNDEKYKVIIIPGIEEDIIDDEVKQDYFKSIDLLKKDGHEIIEADNVNFKVLSGILPVYKVISSVEAFSCNSNLTGFHFGSGFEEGDSYEERMINARTKGFDYEVKKRFLFATEARYSKDKEYDKATKLRKLINEETNRILSLGDVLLIPGAPNLADDIEALNNFPLTNLLNNILMLHNSNGSPSLTMPITKDGHKSTSVNISSLPFNDSKVFKLANRLEDLND